MLNLKHLGLEIALVNICYSVFFLAIAIKQFLRVDEYDDYIMPVMYALNIVANVLLFCEIYKDNSNIIYWYPFTAILLINRIFYLVYKIDESNSSSREFQVVINYYIAYSFIAMIFINNNLYLNEKLRKVMANSKTGLNTEISVTPDSKVDANGPSLNQVSNNFYY